ncbi:MAG: Ig-like domain-containing protein [Anaerolineae bacterium]
MHKRLKQLNIVLIVVLFLSNPLSGLSAGLPRTMSAYDPPPATTNAPSSPSSTPTAARPVAKAPLAPDDLSPEAEQVRVQQAMDATLEKYLSYWGPRYQVAPVEATVAGDWAYGVAEWKSQDRILQEPLNLLAYRSSDGTWQVALPDNDEVFRQWIEAAPEHLLSAPTKDRLRAQAVEAAMVRPLKAMPMVPPPVTNASQSQELPTRKNTKMQPTPTPTASPPQIITPMSKHSPDDLPDSIPTPVQFQTRPVSTISSTQPLIMYVDAGEIHIRDLETSSDQIIGSEFGDILSFTTVTRDDVYKEDNLSGIIVDQGYTLLHGINSADKQQSVYVEAMCQQENCTSKFQLWLADTEQGQRKLLLSDTNSPQPGLLFNPIGWSSAKNEIYLDTFNPVSQDSFTGIWRLQLDTGAMHKLDVGPGGYNSLPLMSPDEKWLLFTGFNDGAVLQQAPFGTPSNMIKIISLQDYTVKVILSRSDEQEYFLQGWVQPSDIPSIQERAESVDKSFPLVPQDIPEATSGFQRPMTNDHSGYTWKEYAQYSCGWIYHPGWDYNGPGACNNDLGIDIHAVADGHVVYRNTSNWGGMVIQHLYQGITIYSQYGHISAGLYAPGENVSKGSHIAELGNVGTDCAHLHWEIRENDHPNPTNGNYWDCNVLKSESQVENYYENPQWWVDNHGPYGGGDTTPPDGDYTSPSNGATITSRTVHMAAWATDNASGVRWVRFNAKWNGEWRTVFEDSSSPYEFDWDLCNSGVPDGDVEISLHIQDNSNNNFYLSDKHPNPHITKNYNCSPPPPSCNPTADQVALYVDANYSGNCVVKNIGQYSNPSAIGLPNDSISSIKVGGNVRAILCRDDNYGGVCETFYGDDPDLSNNSIGNDQVSSAKVEQRASLPAPPTLLSPSNGSPFNEGQSINLSWSATGNEYYGEFWGGPGGTLTFGWQSGTSQNLGPQWAGYTYSWHVKARNSAGESGWSETRTFSVRLAAPTNLVGTATSCTQFTLTWNDNSSNEEGYKIYWYGYEIDQVGANVTSYQGIQDGGHSEVYFVKAYRGSSESDSSGEVVVTTPSCVTPPSAPTLQSPSNGSTFDENQSLTLCWSATGNEYYGEIWGGPAGTLTFGWQGQTCQTIGTQWAGYTYSWHVKARNSAGESGWSNTWTFTVRPNAPSGLVAQAIACDQINLSWTDNSGNEEGYKVYRNGVYIGEVGANVTSYWDTGITENTSYSYYVKAFRGSIESAASNTAYASTPVCPPPDTEPPVVTWTLPVGNEQTYVVENETVQLQVETTDNVGVARVWFVRWDAVNSQWITIGNDYTAPYQTNLDCATLNYTWNQITAVAYDAAGNTDEKYLWLYRLTPAPDLEPYTLPGYPYPVVPSSLTGTHEVNPLYAGQPTYFDWYFANSGTAVATDTFHVELWVDATRYVRYPFSDFEAGWVSGFDDWSEIVSTSGWHVVTLVTDPDDTINESDEGNNLWQEYFYWSPSAPFSDSIESGLNGWTATGLWHQVDDSSTYLPSHSPTHSWWYGQDDTGDYDTGAANSGDLTSPLIYIPASGYFLRFNYAYATETQGPDWDQRWVQISVDGGAFNNVLQLYDDLMYRWLQSPAIDLSGYAGHAIQVRFHFDTFDDYYNAYLGWYIDDVNISTTPPPTCYDAHEPNNTSAQATVLAYGDSPYADICPNGDYDFYRFSGTTGDKVIVDVDASVYGSALDSYIYLLDSDGSTVLTLSDDDYISQDSHLGYELPHDGNYYIKVKAWNHPSVGSPNHFYVLNLLTDDTDPIAEMESPLNGSHLSAITPITVTATDDHGVQHVEFLYHDGDWVNAEWQWLGADWDGSDGWSLDWDTSVITDQSDIAIYIWAFDWVGHWVGTGSWNLTLDRTPPDTAVDISQPYGDAPFRDFWVSWWNSQDNLSGIASYDVQYRDGAGGVWTDLLLGTTEVYTRFVGTDNHTYYFRVRARDLAGNQSNYTEGDGDAQHTVDICDIAADAYEVDDNAANATELLFTNGYTQAHNIHSESNPDWIKFYAVAGFTYTLSTTDLGGHADTVLYLYDTDGSTIIDYNDDYWELGFSSRIDWQPGVSGMYYASVVHWDPWAYGCTTAYGLSVASNDTTAPTGSIVINDGQTYATSSVVTLTLNASDVGTGLAYVLLANNSDFNDGALLSYAPTLTWTLAGGDGNRTVYAQFYDWSGNPSVIYTDDIVLDTAAPLGSVTINGGVTYVTTTLVTLDLSASDANGVAAMRFSNDNTTYSGWVTYAPHYPWTLTGGDGVKTVYAEFQDNVGNISSPTTDNITLDTIAPTGTINLSGGAEYINTPQVTVNLSAADTNGITQMRLSNDGVTYSAWMAYATTTSWTLTTGDGLKTVYVEFRDPAGNRSTAYNDTITLDTASPTGSISINNGDEHTTSRTVTLNLTANDNAAGVNEMLISNVSNFSDASWQAYVNSLTWNLTTGAGTKTVYIKFRDRAGNESAVYSDAIIFYEPVTANFTANPTRGSAPLNVAFTDQSTGSVATWEWNFGDNATSTLRNPVHTYSIPGVYTVSLTVRLPGAAASLTGGTDTLVRTGYITIADTYYIYLPLVVRNRSNALMNQENLPPELGPLPRPY